MPMLADVVDAVVGVDTHQAEIAAAKRYRLNRGGDRALNHALHMIAVVRMRSDPITKTYVARRRAEGKSDREIRRCLKRYISRQLYRFLTHSISLPV